MLTIPVTTGPVCGTCLVLNTRGVLLAGLLDQDWHIDLTQQFDLPLQNKIDTEVVI